MMNSTQDAEQLQFGDVKRVAEITGLCKNTLDKMRIYRPEASPPFLKIGKRVVYPLTGPRGLGAWVDERLAAARGGIQ